MNGRTDAGLPEAEIVARVEALVDRSTAPLRAIRREFLFGRYPSGIEQQWRRF